MAHAVKLAVLPFLKALFLNCATAALVAAGTYTVVLGVIT